MAKGGNGGSDRDVAGRPEVDQQHVMEPTEEILRG